MLKIYDINYFIILCLKKKKLPAAIFIGSALTSIWCNGIKDWLKLTGKLYIW